MKIAVLVGSLRADSLNKKLAANLEKLAPEGMQFDHVDIASLPLFNEELESDYPASASKMKQQIEAADAVLFVTPEYNRSMSGVLKNAIDWGSRPWGKNSFDGKLAAIAGASLSSLGTAVAQAHLRSVLVYLNMNVIGQPEVYLSSAHELFDESGEVVDASKEVLENFVNSLASAAQASK